MQITLFNSLTNKVEEFTPINPGAVRIYSCGPTVYNHAHIGNMRAFIFADLLSRALERVGGWRVERVMNITDIDDKTIRDSVSARPADAAPATGEPLADLKSFTAYYTDKFLEDISALGIDVDAFLAMPRATDFVPQMQELISNIFAKGFAYVAEGSVYFNVEKWRHADLYGKLKKIDFDGFIAGARIDADTYEREQANDFALWKARRPGEPYWDFELGGESLPGRPGWHIECSAMSRELLGLPFDIHTGGVDLKFPHHEDEIAQSKAGYGTEPARFWCHNEFLEVEGEKMSKSAGNFFTLRELVEKGIDPINIRFSMLSAHYGSKFNFTFEGIKAAEKARMKVQEYIYKLFEESSGETTPEEDLLENCFGELAKDLHTPKALGAIFSFINKYPSEKLTAAAKEKLRAQFEEINGVFAAWALEPKPENGFPEEIIELAERRLAAKKAKNWAEADALRNAITEKGYSIKDTKEGYELSEA
ncbi:MAG: cysteine--tRNA ligase [Chloroflexota bacterium]